MRRRREPSERSHVDAGDVCAALVDGPLQGERSAESLPVWRADREPESPRTERPPATRASAANIAGRRQSAAGRVAASATEVADADALLLALLALLVLLGLGDRDPLLDLDVGLSGDLQ
jgi:hypothetical protein